MPMNIKRLILLFVPLIALMPIMLRCTGKPAYGSFDEYPEYTGSDLGLTYTPEKSTFKVWSPAAEEVRLNLYDEGLGGEAAEVIDMKPGEQGTWKAAVDGDLNGKFYTFQIMQEGEWLGETPGPWTKAVGVNGDRAAVIDMATTDPEGWESDVRPPMESFTDAVIYEVHMRDFTVHPSSGSAYPGKFLGLCESGTVSPDGLKTGLDHLKELGVTHIQILPSYDYGSIDETRLDENRYNWGYDPKNYNAVEGGYSTDPYTPATRIREMKEMIMRLHEAGFRVIMDVVYNHTYVGEESHLNLMVPGYFYRFNEDGTWSNASGCGNETASERPMMRRYMIESVSYWVKEFHIDGFRFDLMAIHDIETMRAIRAALDEIDPTISMHGEGWAAADSPLPAAQRALKENARQFAPIAVFSDDIRDAIRGNWVEGDKGGFVAANGFEESVKFGVFGATAHPQVDQTKIVHSKGAYAVTAAQAINYASCHDDPCLLDKLKAVRPEATTDELIRMDKLAQTIVFTSQGVPFIFAGEEILRDKKGVHNSYQSPDSVNAIDWHNKKVYSDVFAYYQGLIAMRKAHPAFRMSDAEMIAESIRFADGAPANTVMFTIDGSAAGDEWSEIRVIYNGDSRPLTTRIDGTWEKACFDGKIGLDGLGSVTGEITVPATSAAVLFRR